MYEPLALLLEHKPPPVDLQSVPQLLSQGHYAEAVEAMWLLGALVIQGEIDFSLSQMDQWLKLVPAPWDRDPRLRYLQSWFLYDQRRCTMALLIMDELEQEWEPQLNGPRHNEAFIWMRFITMAQGTICEHEGRWDRSRLAYSRVRRFLPPVGADPARPQALVLDPGEADALLANDPTGIAPLLMDTLKLLQQYGDRPGTARVAQNLGQQYLERGEPGAARYWLEQALELKRGLKGRWPLSLTLNHLGVCYRQLGMLDEAANVLDEALRIATDVGSVGLQAAVLNHMGDLLRDRDNYETAAELYRRSLALKERARDAYGMAQTQLSLSAMHRRAGHYGLAADCAAEARHLVRGSANSVMQAAAQLHEQVAGVLLHSEGAAEALSATVQRLEHLPAPHYRALGQWYLALAACGVGDPAAGSAMLRSALTTAARCRQVHLLAMELPVSAHLYKVATEQGVCPEALAGLVQRASARGLAALLDAAPSARATMVAAGRMGEATALSINLLGALRVTRAGREIDLGTARSQKAVSLFKFLVAQRGRPVAREQILDAIWPEADPDSADRSFEVTLSTLRRLLELPDGLPLIIRRGRGYLVNPAVPVQLDVERFARHLERGAWWWQRGQTAVAVAEWEQAEAAYGGDFLADDPYEDWATADRERLREQYLDLVLRLGEHALEAGRCSEAVERAHRVLVSDPIREAAYRLLMRAHAKQGNRAVAIRDLQRCREVLQRELGEEPMPETRDLARRILAGDYQ